MWHIGSMPIVPRNYALVVNFFLWTALALVFIIVRLYTRIVIVRKVGLDDWLMTAAMFFSIAFGVMVIYQVKYGLGQPVNLATLKPFLAALFWTVPLYNATQAMYKLSITVQSYRLFTTVVGKRTLQILIGWIIACSIMTVSGSLFYCRPVAKSWDDSINGKCVDRSALNYAVSGFNIVNDLALLAIPVPFLLKLQIAQKQRVVLLSVFACGVIVTIVSIVRLKALYVNLSGPIELQPVTGVDIALWSGLEINVAIICGSVPALKAFVSKIAFGKNNYSFYGYAENITSRKTGSKFGRDDLGDSRMKITVEQSIEMKPYHVRDDGSESDLILDDTFTPDKGNHTTIKAQH